MKKKLLILMLLILIGIGGYFTYHYARVLKADHLSNSNTLTLGWIGPLTGSTHSLGVDGLNTIQSIIQKYNETKDKNAVRIKLLTADVPLGSNAAPQIYHDMVKKKTRLIFVISSDDTIALAKYAKRDGVIIINPLNNDHTMSHMNSNVFLIAKRTELLFVPLVDLMLKRHERKALVLYSTNQKFIVTLAGYFESAFKAAGGTVIMQPYSADVSNFKPLLEEGVRNKVDAYIFMGSAEMGLAVKQAREMKIKAHFYSKNYINSPDVLEKGGAAIDNIIFMDFTYLDGNVLLAQQVLNQYEKNFHRKPYLEWVVLQSYDAINLALRAIRFAMKNRGTFDHHVRDFLLRVRDYEGASGNITIRPDGASEGIIPGIYMMKNGRAEKINR